MLQNLLFKQPAFGFRERTRTQIKTIIPKTVTLPAPDCCPCPYCSSAARSCPRIVRSCLSVGQAAAVELPVSN